MSQGVLTPTLLTVIAHPFSDLQNALARKCNKTVLKWLRKRRPEKTNIVIVDFVLDDDCSCDIVDQVIKSNSIEPFVGCHHDILREDKLVTYPQGG